MTTVAPPRPPDDTGQARAGSSFAPLRRQMQAVGLLKRRTGYYAAAITIDLALLAAAFTVTALLGDTWWQVAMAVPAALLADRIMFFGHDAGHQQIARTRRGSRLLGLALGNVVVGMSEGWWNAKHNKHHANPNHEDKDPDVGAGAIVWTKRQAGARRGAAGRWLARHQAGMFVPLLLLEAVNLKVASLRDLPQRPPRQRAVEIALLAAHYAGYLTLMFTIASPGKALVFIAIQHAITGVHLGLSFAPNHKGMPMPRPGQRWSHLQKQVLTSRNVRGSAVVDWLLGGLNYQVEHHLFPSMPRPNLRRAQALVRMYCIDAGLPYTETGLVESYAIGLRHMRDVGASAAPGPAGAGDDRAA